MLFLRILIKRAREDFSLWCRKASNVIPIVRWCYSKIRSLTAIICNCLFDMWIIQFKAIYWWFRFFLFNRHFLLIKRELRDNIKLRFILQKQITILWGFVIKWWFGVYIQRETIILLWTIYNIFEILKSISFKFNIFYHRRWLFGVYCAKAFLTDTFSWISLRIRCIWWTE